MASLRTKPEPITSQRELARLLGWPGTTLRGRLGDPSCPIPRRGPWPAWAVDALERWAALRYPEPSADDDAAMATGGTSPELERWRRARAALAELELAQRRGQVLPRDQVRELHSRMAGVIRGACDRIQREYGDGAFDVLDEAWTSAAAMLDRWFEEHAHVRETPSALP
ncbi:MAG: hypothetical protein GY842_02410 [bacterium]|nr:hypothetical protein [bacterium]